MERILKHMSWANQAIYAKLQELPDNALKAFISNPDWTVGEIARHIASSNDWYGFRLSGKQYVDFERPTNMQDLAEIARLSLDFDLHLIEQARLPEGEVTFSRDGQEFKRFRSTILSQAVHHCTEHRAQLVTALEYKGFKSINLDDYDLWSFEAMERK